MHFLIHSLFKFFRIQPQLFAQYHHRYGDIVEIQCVRWSSLVIFGTPVLSQLLAIHSLYKIEQFTSNFIYPLLDLHYFEHPQALALAKTARLAN